MKKKPNENAIKAEALMVASTYLARASRLVSSPDVGETVGGYETPDEVAAYALVEAAIRSILFDCGELGFAVRTAVDNE